MNKKVLIPIFATAMGLSVIGGISGAVAWYQYNSRVTASYVGTSVADTGVLQIGWDGASGIEWGRDYAEMEGNKLYPVTFGALQTVSEKPNCLPSQGYYSPEAGAGEGYANHNSSDPAFPHWLEASEGAQYAQFSLYFKATQTDGSASSGRKAVARKVYFTDVVLKCVDAGGNEAAGKIAEQAIRVHMDVENGTNRLFSKSQVTDLALSGGLDLDNSGHADQYHATLFNNNLGIYGNHPATTQGNYPEGHAHAGDPLANSPYYDGETIVYGNAGELQSTESFATNLASRDSTTGQITGQDEKALFTTTTDEAAPIKVTFTVWLEGWATLGGSNIWNPSVSAGCDIQVGLRFDTGLFRDADLSA